MSNKVWKEKETGEVWANMELNKNFNPLEESLVHHINFKNKKVLEIGFGNGEVIKIVEGLGASKVQGLDINKVIVDEAKKKGIDALQGNVYKYFKTNKEQYDVIIAFYSLIHAKDSNIKELLEDIASSIKPGGFFWLSQQQGNTESWDFPPAKNMGIKHFTFNEQRVKSFKPDSLEIIEYKECQITSPGFAPWKNMSVILRKK